MQSYVEAAQQAGNTQGALLLAELQMWWEPCWAHLQALSPLCSPQKFGLRRQQLQSLALNDNMCRADTRFEVLVRENMHTQAIAMVSALAQENASAAHMALKGGIEMLGQEVLAQTEAMEALFPLLEKLASQSEGADMAFEALAPMLPQRVILFYDSHIDTWHRYCQQNSVTAATKATMRSWLGRCVLHVLFSTFLQQR